MTLPLAVRAYLALTAVAPALLSRPAARAHARQGADPARWRERLGHAGLPRPAGRVIWLHAASVGEVASAMPLASDLIRETGAALLITTTTRTGAQSVVRRLPEGAIHRFQPLDTPAAVARFLDHWRPDLVLLIEADLWPRMILSCSERGIPMALLNARASRSRERAPRTARALLSRMRLITAQTPAIRDGLIALGLDPGRVQAPGDLKADTPPLPCDPERLADLRRSIGARPVWAAVSTHPGEEEIALEAHARLRATWPDALLILVPRHPERADGIAEAAGRRGLSLTRHSTGEKPEAAVHLVDAIGETGLVYRLCPLALLGGSLLPGPGGHTPFEPAALGLGVLHGPHVRNFAAAYEALDDAGAAGTVRGAGDLARVLEEHLSGDAARRMGEAARTFAAGQSGARAATLAILLPILAGGGTDARP